MGAIGLLLDAVSVAVTSVGGGFGWWTPGGKCSTDFALTHAVDAKSLRGVLASHADAVGTNDLLLAKARLIASAQLLKRLLSVSSRIHSRELFFQERSQAILRTRNRAFSSMVMSEEAAESAKSLRKSVEAILAFVAMHSQTCLDIRTSMRSSNVDPALLVRSCRQIASFLDAVQTSRDIEALTERVTDLVNTYVADKPARRKSRTSGAAGASSSALPDNDAAAPLGQFLRRGGSGASPTGTTLLPVPSTANVAPMSPADVRRTLEAIRLELRRSIHLEAEIQRLVSNGESRSGGVSNALRRSPIWYAEVAVIGVTCTRFLATRTRFLGGTGDLEDVLATGIAIVRTFVADRICLPATRLYHQIFRSAPEASASFETVAAQREALHDMLIDYTTEHLKDVPGAQEAATRGDTSLLMKDYVQQVRNPTKSFAFGNLARTMLVQVQKLKADVEELVVKSKLSLQAMELNLALVALIPAFFTIYGLFSLAFRMLARWRRRHTRFIVSPQDSIRFLLANVHKQLVFIQDTTPVDGYDHLVRLGNLKLAVFECRQFLQAGIISVPEKVFYNIMDEFVALEDDESSIEARLLQVNRIWASYPAIFALPHLG